MEGTWRLFQAKTTRREAEFSDCTVYRSASSPSQAAGRNLCFEGLPPALPSSQTNRSSSPAGQTVCELLLPVHRASNTGNGTISRVAWDRHELPIPQPCVARAGPEDAGCHLSAVSSSTICQHSGEDITGYRATGGAGGVSGGGVAWRGVAGSEPLNPFGPSGDCAGQFCRLCAP